MNRSEEPKGKKSTRICPYCEGEILEAGFPYCKPCNVTLRYCARCQIAVVREATVCPQCGGELEWR
ncbi:unnamed protein product [marine sediment metagenome]|uniref:DZANK-type domain-containing protein n=1 Tax=marine sediment metagenome TaxID=412755 RepID=X0XSC4_9ZZZZ